MKENKNAGTHIVKAVYVWVVLIVIEKNGKIDNGPARYEKQG